jgi:hypothetical protein
MTAFADLHELVNRLSGGNSGTPQFLVMHKEQRVSGAAAATSIVGMPISLLQYEGMPSHGAAPGALAYPDNTTTGGWKQTDPSGARTLWMTSVGAACNVVGTLVLYDRLAHISGLSGATITAQNVLATTLTRYATGLGNFIAYEIYTQIGITATTITCDYTNQAGTASRTTTATVIGATNKREAQRFQILGLQAGDTGVRAVNTATVLATTGTAGDFGIVVGHPLAYLHITGPQGSDVRSFLDGPMTEILTDACLCWYFVPAVTTAFAVDMWATMVER